MKKLKRIVVVLAVMISFAVAVPFHFTDSIMAVEAHSGRTDCHGGHRDHKNRSGLGSYHCGGYPAHLHTNGVCPYDSASVIMFSETDTTDSDISDAADDTLFELESAESGYDNAIFSAEYYLTEYPELAVAVGDDEQALFNHFCHHGMTEGRQGCETFNVHTYIAKNPDLQQVFGDDLAAYYQHYLDCGQYEGRIAY